MSEKKYAIRFGLGAIKAVGIKMMDGVVANRKEEGGFNDIFDFAKRIDPKSVNKKSIEALAKSGAFDEIADNRRQIFESYDVLSAYSAQQHDEANSNQMTFFGELVTEEQSKPQLKNVTDWDKDEMLQKEFEAFGFFLMQHPLDDLLEGLKRRGCVFSEKIQKDEFDDGDEVKFPGVIAATKHRSSAKGRFAYGTISDPFGIYEIMIFDEELITQKRDLLEDGCVVLISCMVRKDEGGIRILTRDIQRLEDFIANTEEKSHFFEDIKKNKIRKRNPDQQKKKNDQQAQGTSSSAIKVAPIVDSDFNSIEIAIGKRESIYEIKSFLSLRKAKSDQQKTCQVIFKIADQKVQLPERYVITNADINKLSRIESVTIDSKN